MNRKLITILVALAFLIESFGGNCLSSAIHTNKNTLRPAASKHTALSTIHSIANKSIQESRSAIKDIFTNSKNVYADLIKLEKQGVLAKAFPGIEGLEEKIKIGKPTLNVYDHTLQLIEYLEIIEKNDLPGFNKDKKGKRSWLMKKKTLNRYHNLFMELTDNGRDKNTRALLYFMVLFHDIGELEDKRTHHIKGAEMALPLLIELGYSEKEIEKFVKVICAHVDLGTIFTAERTPGYLLSSPESLNIASLPELDRLQYLKILALLTVIDVRSLRNGMFITAKNADFYVNATEKGFIDKLADGFFQRRVEFFCSTNSHKLLGTKLQAAEDELKQVKSYLSGKMAEFKRIIGTAIEYINYGMYFLQKLPGRAVVKMFCIMYKFTKGTDFRRVDFTAGTASADDAAMAVYKCVLKKITTQEILSADKEKLRQRLSDLGLKVREESSKIVIDTYAVYEMSHKMVVLDNKKQNVESDKSSASFSPQLNFDKAILAAA